MSNQPSAMPVYTQGFATGAMMPPVMALVPPSTADINYDIGREWIDQNTRSVFKLVSKSSSQGTVTANWTLLGGSGALEELIADDGSIIVPTGGAITIDGSATQGISTSGSGSTLTITVADATTTQKGVLETATNAEAIAGSSVAVAVTPAALNAKIGTQTNHGVALGGGSTAALSYTAVGTTGQVLTGATGADPVWASPALPSGLTDHGVVLGQGASPVVATAVGTDGQVLTGNSAADPTFSAIGTKSGLTNHGVILGQGASAFVATGAGVDGHVLTGSTGLDPAFTALGTNSGLTNHGIVLAQGNVPFVATAVGATGEVLTGVTGGDPVWAAPALPTGLTDHGVVLGQGASAVVATSAGTLGQPLVSGGASADPAFAVLGVVGGGTGVATLTSGQLVVGAGTSPVTAIAYTALSTGSTVASRSAEGNTVFNNAVSETAAVVSAAGTTVLTSASSRIQELTGATTQTFQLPDATTLGSDGWTFEFDNNSTDNLSVVDAGSNPVATVVPGGYAIVFVTDVSTANGVWDHHYMMPASASFGDASLSVNGNVIASKSSAAATVSVQATNSDNTAPTSHAQVQIAVGGTSGGSPGITWQVSGAAANDWVAGADRANSYRWALSEGSAVGVTDALRVAHTTRDVEVVDGDFTVTAGNVAITNGNLSLATAGNKINIASGANASVGQFNLTSGATTTVSTTAVTTNSVIILTRRGINGSTALGELTVGTITNGTSFDVYAADPTTPATQLAGDTSTVNWMLIN